MKGIDMAAAGDESDMNYRFGISVKLVHPTMHLDAVIAGLDWDPNRGWTVGEPRTTPIGTPLEGNNKETFWSQAWDVEEERNFFNEVVRTLREDLLPHADFL